jgi:BASS family bile acid:Na+ symporter
MAMQTVLNVSIPIIAILIMVALGLELTLEDFRNVARSHKLVTGAMIGQILFLPLAAIGLVQTLPLQPHIATGLLLIASCPAGGMSNYYTYLAGARTALSVVLTAGSCLAALVTMPLVWMVYELYLGHTIGFAVPVSKLMAQLFLMLVFPVFLGMLIRHYRLAFATRHEAICRRMSLAGLGALIAYIVLEEGGRVAGEVMETAVAAGVFLGVAMVAGYTIGVLSGGDAKGSFTLLIEFAVRNVAIATAIAVTVLGRVEFAIFATAYFLIEVPLLFTAVLLFRMKAGSAVRMSVSSAQ